MMIGSGAILRAVTVAFLPGWWAILYQAPLGIVIAYVVARQQARDSIGQAAIRRVALIVGGGGALLFFLMSLLPSPLTLLLALAIMWVGTSFALDKHLDVDWESSQRVTGVICLSIWLPWLIIGVVFEVLRALH